MGSIHWYHICDYRCNRCRNLFVCREATHSSSQHCKKFLRFKTKFTGNYDPGVKTGSNWNVRLNWHNGVTILNRKRNFLSQMGTVRSVYVKKLPHRFIQSSTLCWKNGWILIETVSSYFSEIMLTVSKLHFSLFQQIERLWMKRWGCYFSSKRILPFPSLNGNSNFNLEFRYVNSNGHSNLNRFGLQGHNYRWIPF